jgi:cytochrome c-type biogenesis protein CcmF
MMHYFIGDLGHLFVITSFITAIVTGFTYFKGTVATDLDEKGAWLQNGRFAFYLHATAVLGICVTLFVIIANHYFEYHYAYSYSDTKLPDYYLVSTFWNGQEGSFLLWMFWHVVLGIILIHTNRFWEAPVMTVFALVQAFLASMILGVVIPGVEVKIGSSPFILLRDVMQDAPIFKSQPEFIPEDGRGLNPLLQNYWMVIHPPTLFLGFAATLVPFSFCIAGLWLKLYRDWIRPALPWALFAGAILGLGILMGGYWAYETLNFGGYWNWDPVENAVYVPWLILIGSIHTMISYKNSETSLKAAIILTITVFVLILYSTFLTRSGILGDSSVHSFTDLGLSGQLLIYLLFFLVVAVVLSIIRWKEIPSAEQELDTYSREFWILIGVLVLTFMGFQVLVGTSFPVFNAFLRLFGIESNLAPSTDPLYFSKFQMWLAVGVGVLSAIGQFFWWKKIDRKVLLNELFVPLVISILLALIVVNITNFYKVKEYQIGWGQLAGYALLLLAGFFTIISNGKILYNLFKSSPALSGGAVAHIGIGLMLIGIMYSAGYSKVVSLNNTGMLISRNLSDEYNREHLLLFVNEPRTMAGYKIEYRGERLEPRDKPGFIDPSDVIFTSNPYKVVAKKNIEFNGRQLYNANDSIEIYPENTYYELELTDARGKLHKLYPRVQDNPSMGLAPSPDIKRDITKDLYAHVDRRSSRDDIEWSKPEELKVRQNQQFFANDYVAVLENVERIYNVQGVELDSSSVAVKASIRVKGEQREYLAEPIFIIQNRMVARIPDESRDLGILFTLVNIHPETGEFTLSFSTRQKDWIVLRALEKPYINVLWLGTLVVMTGFGIAISRRIREFRMMKAKGQE